jgi:hypothetical protein
MLRQSGKIEDPSETFMERSSSASRCARWASLAKSGLGAAFVVGVLTAGQAQALVVSVPGYGNWDVTTFEGSYNAESAKFNNDLMPWLGSKPAADAFASAIASSLGFPNYFAPDDYGPLFAYDDSPSLMAVAWRSPPASVLSAPIVVLKGSSNTWAQASVPAPGPLPALGAAAAFGFSRQLRKRIKSSGNSVSITSDV